MSIGIHIPLDERRPMEPRTFTDLEDYQDAVGGHIEAIEAGWEHMSFFANTDAKLVGLGINRRATLLWWLHMAPIRNRDLLAGDVVMVGPADTSGATKSVPCTIQRLLFTPSTYVVEVRVTGSDKWHRNPQSFENYFDAALWALELDELRREVIDIRVITT